MSFSDTTSRVISVSRAWAASITASRSLSLPRFSPVRFAWFSIPVPSHSAMPERRPPSSALDCASAAKRASIASCRSSAMSRSRRRAAGGANQRDEGEQQQQRQRGESRGERVGEIDRDAVDDGDGGGCHGSVREGS